MTVAFQVRDRVLDSGGGGDSERLLSEGEVRMFSRSSAEFGISHRPTQLRAARPRLLNALQAAPLCMFLSLGAPPFENPKRYCYSTPWLECLLLTSYARLCSALLIILSSNYLDGEFNSRSPPSPISFTLFTVRDHRELHHVHLH